jgi:putative membrane protein
VLGVLRKLLALAVALLMAGLGLLFALQNPDPVPLDILVVQLPPRSLALWVLGALALGGVLGVAFSSFAVLRLRASLIAARRQVVNARAELDRVRSRDLASRG